nr:uncharacterized protein LOC109424673 [Aedes albopictus]
MPKPRSAQVNSRVKPRKPAKGKAYPTHRIPRSKLNAALKFLEEKSSPAKYNTTAATGGCFKSILDKAGAARSRRVEGYANDNVNMLEVARQCALRGQWANLIKTFQIQMQGIRRYDLPVALRNSLFAIIADPALNDPSFLEAYLYSNPYCANQTDLKYCVDKILEVFQGVTIRSSKWNPDLMEDASETEREEANDDESSVESLDDDSYGDDGL